VEPSGDGFVLAPDFKFTEMNNRTTGFAGFYGGAVFAGQVMLGGGAYFQLDDYASEQMAYGGFVAEYRLFHDHPVGVALHGLAGFGATNLPIYGHGGRYAYYGSCEHGHAYYGCPYDGFFIGEPEVELPRGSATACGPWAASATGSPHQSLPAERPGAASACSSALTISRRLCCREVASHPNRQPGRYLRCSRM
jgi:hypothetical protein